MDREFLINILCLWLLFCVHRTPGGFRTGAKKNAPADRRRSVLSGNSGYRLNALAIKSTISAPMRACASLVEAPMCGVLLTCGCM